MNPNAPFTLNSLDLPNRWVLAPMTTYSSRPDGVVNDDELPYFKSRAEAGFGLVLSPACYVHPSGHAFDGQWSCADDRYLDSLRSVADAMHAGGAKAVLQIHHGGRQCPSRLCGGISWSASAIPSERPNAETPREIAEPEIETIIQCFADAARRGEQAGFDAIEIHGANTYLIQQFVSPHSNRRQDKWGQDRLLFSREIVRACKAACQIPVGYRLSPEEPETPGIRLGDTFPLIEMLIEEGVAWIDVSLREFNQSSLHDPESIPVLKQITDRVAGRVPIMAGGAVLTAANADECLALGADLVYVGRGAIMDRDFLATIGTGNPIPAEIPATEAAKALTLPAGLEQKIYSTPGWFPIAK